MVTNLAPSDRVIAAADSNNLAIQEIEGAVQPLVGCGRANHRLRTDLRPWFLSLVANQCR